MKDNVAILLLFFNKWSETLECIESFLPSGVPIYVLNNGSEPRLWENLKRRYALFPQFRFLHSDRNIGPSKGRNLLIRQAAEEWLFFVDNDIAVSPILQWLQLFTAFVQKNPFADVVCPRLFNVHENEYAVHPTFAMNERDVFLRYEDTPSVNYFPSGASIVNRRVFVKHGFFEENIFAFEDYEYAIRLLCKSVLLQIGNLGDVTLVHNHQFQKRALDKQSVKERYSEEKLRKSFAAIEEKHNVTFNHNWEWWTKRQVIEMTTSPFIGKLKKALKRIVRQ